MPPPAKLQELNHFITTVLSHHNPSSLPYTKNTKSLIQQHLFNLISSYTSLTPKTSSFTHNDGRSVILLQADGTIPINFHGVTYNIPVVIWLFESYPYNPPCVYVNPTRDMIIKRFHSNVSPSGLVSIPYLHDWIYPRSNLVDLVDHLSAAFSRDLPLYSQRRPPPSIGSAQSRPSPSPSIGSAHSRPFPSPSIGSAHSRPFPSPSIASARSRSLPPPRRTDDATEIYKKNAINKLVEMLDGDLVLMRSGREAEAEGLLSLQSNLKRKEEEIHRGLQEMIDEKETLEQELQVIAMNIDFVESWIRENKEKAKNLLANLDEDDDAFECIEILSKQMLECTALDLAIEDTVYSMDKSFRNGSLSFDQYLRNVRLLSREQFFYRATAEKVRAIQIEAQVASQ